MPYQPSQTDISGQLRGQGIAALGKGLGEGVAEGIAAYKQNKFLSGQAIAKFEALANADNSILGVLAGDKAPIDASKAYKKLQKDGSLGVRDASALAQFADSYQKAQGEMQQRKMAEAQMAHLGQQSAMLGQQQQMEAMKMDQARREQQQLEKLQQIGQFAGGAGRGVLRADVQGQMQGQLDQNPFLAQAAQLARATGRLPSADELVRLQTGGAPTSAMRDTDAIIRAEIAGGRLPSNAAAVAGRRAELLAAGGRDPGPRFDNAGTFVDTDTGANARVAVKDRNTGRIGYVDAKGDFKPLDVNKWKPSTVGDTNALLDPPGMEKLREKVIADERSVRGLGRYLNGFENLEQGAGQLADRVTKAVNTALKQPLTDKQKALGEQEGRLQQILGSLRTTVVGPGTMTETDAQRILNALGGDIGALQNQAVVKTLIGEILSEKLKEYESDLDIYNTHVVRKYGAQAGYQQRGKVPIEFKKAEATAPAPIDSLLDKYK